jgi:hypothetical protein
MKKAVQFLDRYLLRTLAGLACLLGLAGAIAGYFAGIKRHECTMLAVVSSIAGLLAFIPRSDSSFHLLPRKKREPYVSPYTVHFDDEAITVTFKNKKGESRESVRWADLAVVGITIRDTYLPEPYWTLAGMPGTGGCIYSNDAIGGNELLRALQERLPGFDNVALIQAMGMMSGGVRIWERADWKSALQAGGAPRK